MISSCHFDFRFCIDFQCLAGIFASGGWVGKHLSLGVAGVFFAFSQCFRFSEVLHLEAGSEDP